MITRILISPMVGFGITLLTTAIFSEYVKTWEIKNAFPIFVAAVAAYIIGGIRVKLKEET